MRKALRVVVGLYEDGFKALSLFAPLLSIAFTISKALDLVSNFRDVPYPWALLPITIWLVVAYTRRWAAFGKQIEAPRPPASSLSQMSVSEIAWYVRDKSQWGWQQRLGLSAGEEFLNHLTAEEMRRAAKAGQVRFLGAPPNTFEAVEIDRTYWQSMTFDQDRIMDGRNASFTTAPNGGAYPQPSHYSHGTAPRIEVMRTWRPASWMLRQKVRFVEWRRKKKWARAVGQK